MNERAATPEDFFADHDEARRLFEPVRRAIEEDGPADVRVTKSQIAFRRTSAFAFVWMPEMYLRGADAPLVLTIGLRRRDESPRWEQVVEPAPGRFTHHLEVRSESDIDDEVRGWQREAWELAGPVDEPRS